MTRRSDDTLEPKNGHTLFGGIAARISGCQNQKEMSLDDQVDNAKEAIAELYTGPAEFNIIATVGKGERLDRPELEQIEAAYKSGFYDVFVFDDLSRLIRGGEAARLLGIGVDHGTRSICIDDGIDTIDETWEEDALNACSENVAHQQKTSKRIKQKTMNRFKKRGTTPKRPIYGYIVPPEATSYDEWRKNSDAVGYLEEGAKILRATLNGEAVADYFNSNHVPVGQFAQNERWDGTMVLRQYRNPILKGTPQRGRMATVKHHGSGKRSSKKNPKGPTFYDAPHLAFFEPDEFDDLVEALAESNKNYRRKRVNGNDPRSGVSRNRTRFPGQHARCLYCGRTYNWGANGITGSLMCSGSHKYLCWNSVGINGRLVVARVRSAITDILYQLEGFDAQFHNIVNEAKREFTDHLPKQLKQIESEELQLAREKANLLSSIKAFGPKLMMLDEMKLIERQERAIAKRRRKAEKSARRDHQFPRSAHDLRISLESQFAAVNADPPEFGDLLRSIVPEFDVYLVRLIDGGHCLPRARLKMSFSSIAGDVAHLPELDAMLTRVLTIDLFDAPQRERIRLEAIQLKSDGLTQRQIASSITEHPSHPAVQNAIKLHKRMIAENRVSPYVVLNEPPGDYKKLRRHRNSKYRFTPLKGYVRPDL